MILNVFVLVNQVNPCQNLIIIIHCFLLSQVVFLLICLNPLLTEVEPVGDQLLAPQKIKKYILSILLLYSNCEESMFLVQKI